MKKKFLIFVYTKYNNKVIKQQQNNKNSIYSPDATKIKGQGKM